MAHVATGISRGATPSTRALAFAACAVALGLLAWRGSEVMTRTPASPGPLSQSEAALLSVAEAVAGQGHVRISLVRQPGGVRQVLLLVDTKAGVDDASLSNTVSLAAGLDAAKGERVDLQRVAFAPGVSSLCWPCWQASPDGSGSGPNAAKRRLWNWCRKHCPRACPHRPPLNRVSVQHRCAMTMPQTLPAGILAAPPRLSAPGWAAMEAMHERARNCPERNASRWPDAVCTPDAGARPGCCTYLGGTLQI